jgi:hypothetical protein
MRHQLDSVLKHFIAILCTLFIIVGCNSAQTASTTSTPVATASTLSCVATGVATGSLSTTGTISITVASVDVVISGGTGPYSITIPGDSSTVTSDNATYNYSGSISIYATGDTSVSPVEVTDTSDSLSAECDISLSAGPTSSSSATITLSPQNTSVSPGTKVIITASSTDGSSSFVMNLLSAPSGVTYSSPSSNTLQIESTMDAVLTVTAVESGTSNQASTAVTFTGSAPTPTSCLLQPDPTNAVSEIYVLDLGRAAQSGEILYQSDMISTNLPIVGSPSVQDNLINGSEYQLNGGANAVRVEALYETILCRTYDSGGLSYWTGQLNSGTLTYPEVVAAFIASPEFQSHNYDLCSTDISAIYHKLLARNPTATELGSSFQQLINGDADIYALNNNLYTGQEFANDGGLPFAQVVGLYRVMLGRFPAVSEAQGWLGNSYTAISSGIYNSQEFQARSCQ